MIEVIRHGNSYKEVVCRTCACEFYYQNEDTKIMPDLENLEKSIIYVLCPECRNVIYLTSD